jgi:hypothetical protein
VKPRNVQVIRGGKRTWWMVKTGGEFVRYCPAVLDVFVVRAGKDVLIGNITSDGKTVKAWPHPGTGAWTNHRSERTATAALMRAFRVHDRAQRKLQALQALTRTEAP